MTRVCWLVVTSMLAAACGTQGAPAAERASAHQAKAYSNLAQMMRGIPFPSSNIIFDTQTIDPAAPPTSLEHGIGATQQFASVYGGWQQVENHALALAESASLMLIPGRVCENGNPVPVQREDFRRYAEGLMDVGMDAYRAAQARNLDKMIDLSDSLSEACAACHEVYRDFDDPKDRCVIPTTSAAE